MKKLLILIFISSYSLIFAENLKSVRVEVSPIPFKDASMIQSSQSYDNIYLNAQIIDDIDLQKGYFDENLSSDKIIPVLVYITNYNKQKIVVNGLETSLILNGENLKRIEPKNVINSYISKLQAKFTAINVGMGIWSLGIFNLVGASDADEIAFIEDIRNIFYNKTLKHKVLLPGETTSGFVYFTKEKDIKKEGTFNIPIEYTNSLKKVSVSANIY